MIPIIIDTTSLPFDAASNKDLVERVVDSVVKDITASLAREWEQQAIQGLHQTRERYINNLFVVDEGRMQGSVVLDYSKDPMIRMIEEGASAYDLKDGFAKSSKKKMKADGGWYLTIPFRQATPGAVAESSVFSSKMPSEIYDIVRNKEANIDIPGGGKRSVGLKIGEIPEKYQIKETRAGDNIPESKAFKEYQHKSSLYEGITKIQDSKTGQSMYMSFRRVSDNSDPNSWIHPGMDVQNFGDKALSKLEQNMEVELNMAVNKILAAIGF